MDGTKYPVSYLFVPALDVDRIPKALASGADRVILDLEDGVSAADKAQAREQLAGLELSVPVICRINSRSSEHHESDLNLIRELPFIEGIMLPKTERAEDIQSLRNYLPSGIRLLALIETALGNLGRKLNAAEQRIIVKATRTPHQVPMAGVVERVPLIRCYNEIGRLPPNAATPIKL